jgi:predicted signal transduction protein with EAL and GGDEF domain
VWRTRILEALKTPFNLSSQEVFVTASIGIALSSTGYSRPQDVLRDADTAMYRAKAMGKARFQIFDSAMHLGAVKLLQIENDLRRAIDRCEFELHYQPIVGIDNCALRGFEALIRWRHPERGLIAPVGFYSRCGRDGHDRADRPLGVAGSVPAGGRVANDISQSADLHLGEYLRQAVLAAGPGRSGDQRPAPEQAEIRHI